MTVRTRSSTVEFSSAFQLSGDEEILPAGTYQVDTDEEAFEATGYTVYRRVETRMRIQTPGKTVHRRVNPNDLESALLRDREAQSTETKPVQADTVVKHIDPQTAAAAPANSIWSAIIRAAGSWGRRARSRDRTRPK